MSANHATSAQDPLYLDYFCRIGVSTSFNFSVGFYRYNVQQNDFKKDFRAKTAKIAKKFFSISPNLVSFAPLRESSFLRSSPLSLDIICLPRSTRRSRRIYNQIISAPVFQTPRLAAGYYSNLVSLCALRALRGDISLLSALCVFARVIFYPIP